MLSAAEKENILIELIDIFGDETKSPKAKKDELHDVMEFSTDVEIKLSAQLSGIKVVDRDLNLMADFEEAQLAYTIAHALYDTFDAPADEREARLRDVCFMLDINFFGDIPAELLHDMP